MRFLIETWKKVPFDRPPYLFPGDEVLQETSLTVTHSTFDDFIKNGALDIRQNTALHLGLLPVPYVGDLEKASVFFLMLNPGFQGGDYFAESRIDEFRKALIRNLRQENVNNEYPFICLDPRFCWHGGYQYWEGKLYWLVRKLAKRHDLSYQEGLSLLAQKICALELVPYHSTSYRLPAKLVNGLASRQTMLRFVKNDLVERAKNGKALLVVTRGAAQWGLKPDNNIIIYSGLEARRAHLTENSSAGTPMKRFLGLGD